jgi:ABC-2 type transport system ATP-binding protein
VKTYSGGMRRRLDIAVSLIGRPQVLFLDEPTTGLDPRSRATMWDVVRRLVDEGVTVLLTTQYLDEADHLADRIAVIDGGLIVAQGTSAELKAQVGGQRIDLVLPDQCAYDDARLVLGDEAVRRDRASRSIGVATQGSAIEVRTLLDRLDRHDVRVDSLSMHTTTLDEVFLSLTGRPRDESTLTAEESSHV